MVVLVKDKDLKKQDQRGISRGTDFRMAREEEYRTDRAEWVTGGPV